MSGTVQSSLQVNYLIFVTKYEGTVVDLPLTVMWIRAFRTTATFPCISVFCFVFNHFLK